MNALADKVHKQEVPCTQYVICTPYNMATLFNNHIPTSSSGTPVGTKSTAILIEQSLHHLEIFYGDLFMLFFDCYNYIL